MSLAKKKEGEWMSKESEKERETRHHQYKYKCETMGMKTDSGNSKLKF